MTEQFINTDGYSVPELVLFGIGCFMWVIVYALYARHIFRHKMIGMPVFAAASNFGWEFVWGFVQPYTDMGTLFLWGYRAWFLIDLYIFYGLMQHGAGQVSIPAIKQYFKPLMILTALCWGIIYYFFKIQGFDTPIGANSAYIAQFLISILYLLLILRHHKLVWSSYSISWLRSLGTGFISVFMVLHYPDNYFLLTLCALSAMLDGVYLFVFHRRMAVDHATATGG